MGGAIGELFGAESIVIAMGEELEGQVAGSSGARVLAGSILGH